MYVDTAAFIKSSFKHWNDSLDFHLLFFQFFIVEWVVNSLPIFVGLTATKSVWSLWCSLLYIVKLIICFKYEKWPFDLFANRSTFQQINLKRTDRTRNSSLMQFQLFFLTVTHHERVSQGVHWSDIYRQKSLLQCQRKRLLLFRCLITVTPRVQKRGRIHLFPFKLLITVTTKVTGICLQRAVVHYVN